MGEITLVTDFFDIGRGEDKNQELKRNAERYFKEFSHWARIQNQLIVYTDSKSAARVMEIRAGFGLADKTTVVTIDNLFELEGELFERMKKNAQNPAFLKFRYIPEAFSNNPKYDYLWLMKYYFMNDAYNKGLLSENVAWIDFGFDHGGLRYYPEDFDFKWECDFGDKINIFCLYDPDTVAGIEILQYLDDCVLGNMHGLPRELVPTFWELVRKALEALIMLDCVDDDQMLVLMAYKLRPELFKVHVSDWHMQMKALGCEHLRVKEKTPAKVEHPVKKKVRLAVRKVIPNKKDPKRIYARKCYETAVKFFGK